MIEVGEYVRTILGNITKVVTVKDTVVWTDDFIDGFGKYHEGIIKTTDIVKHSKNIIDLIEKGDYVNGYLVTAIHDEYKNDNTIQFETNYEGRYRYYSDGDIKSIVTKEKFEAMEYKVKE